MKVAATDETLAQVLARGFFQIPRFQRPYSWDEQEVGEWLTDTFGATGDYFVGSMVAYSDGNVLQIVDGQQRLTTVTLFMAAVRDHLIKLDEAKLARGAQGFIEKQDREFNNRFILETTSSRPYLQNAIQTHPEDAKEEAPIPWSPEERLLRGAYKMCYDRLEELMNVGVTSKMQIDRRRKKQVEQLRTLRDKMLKLTLIYIELDNEDDAYSVFETLNFRGKDLTSSDLIRSHVMKMIRPTNSSIDNTRERWTKIEQQLSESQLNFDISDFLYTSWLSRSGATPKKSLSRIIKSKVKSESAARDYLTNLESDVKLYRGIYEPNAISWAHAARPMKRPLAAIQQLEVNQHVPLLLTAFRASRQGSRVTHQKVLRLVEAIESFYYLTTAIVGKRPPGGFGTFIASISKELERADTRAERAEVIDRAIKRLKDQASEPDDIRSAVCELRFSRIYSAEKHVVRHILERLHRSADTSDATDYEKMSIEHIAPVSQLHKGLNWSDLSAIGNLLLVPKRVNEKSLRDRSFDFKKSILLKYTTADDPIHNANVWTSVEIQQRTKWISEQVVTRFYTFRR